MSSSSNELSDRGRSYDNDRPRLTIFLPITEVQNFPVRVMIRPLVSRFFSMDRRYRQTTKVDTSKIPYAVNRTASGNLPVYIRIRGINREHITLIESVYGDTNALISDLRMTVCGDAFVSESGRTIEAHGRFAKQIKKWLQSLGF